MYEIKWSLKSYYIKIIDELRFNISLIVDYFVRGYIYKMIFLWIKVKVDIILIFMEYMYVNIVDLFKWIWI